MDPQLVGPPGFGRQLHQGKPPYSLQDPVRRRRRLPRRVNPPLDGRGRVPADGQLDPPPLLRRTAQADSQIGPMEGPRMEPPPEKLVDIGGLRRRGQAGGAPVQPVHQMEGAPLPQVVQKPRRQGGLAGNQGGGNRRQRRGLVHYQQVLVLKAHVQRHGHGPQLRGPLRRRQVHRQPVPLPEDGVGKHPPPVDRQAGFRPLQPADQGGGEAQLPLEEALHGPALLGPGHYQLQRRHNQPPYPAFETSIPHLFPFFNRGNTETRRPKSTLAL